MNSLLKSKVLSGLLISLVLLTAVSINFAIGGDGQKVKSLSLQEATDLAVKNNSDYQISLLNLEKSKLEMTSTQFTAKELIDKEANASGKEGAAYHTYDMALAMYYAPKAAETNYLLTQKNVDLAQKQLKLSVERYYYNVLKAEKNLQIKQENLKYLQNQLNITQAAYKLGTRAKLDVNTMEANVAAAQADVTSANNTYKSTVMDLNKTIGLDLDTPVQLTTRFTVEKVGGSIKLDQVIKIVLSDDVTSLTAQKNLELSELKNQITLKYYPTGGKTSQTTKLDEKIAQINCQKQQINLTAIVKQNYMTLLSLEKVLDWNNKEVAKAQENAKIYTAKYQAGLATSSEVQDAAIKLDQAKKNFSDSIYNYNSLKSQFKLDVFAAVASQF